MSDCPTYNARATCERIHHQVCALAANRDRRFVEAVRKAFNGPCESFDGLIDHIDEVHQSIYGTPCTAAVTTASTTEER